MHLLKNPLPLSFDERPSVGADLSCPAPIYRPLEKSTISPHQFVKPYYRAPVPVHISTKKQGKWTCGETSATSFGRDKPDPYRPKVYHCTLAAICFLVCLLAAC